MSAAKVQMPQLEVFNRMLELPIIEQAVVKSAKTYSKVKDSHQLVYWALSTAESSLNTATRQAAPYARKLETPISFVDHTLCRGLDTIEKKVPIVKEKPEMILENAYMVMISTALPVVSTLSYANDYITSHAAVIKNTSWNNINKILSTEYGNAMVHKLEHTAASLDQLLDKYFPPLDKEPTCPEIILTDDDKLLHTLQTVGRLSNKAARRVYSHVRRQIRDLKRDNLRAYLARLVEFLQLARYITVPLSTPRKLDLYSNGKGLDCPIRPQLDLDSEVARPSDTSSACTSDDDDEKKFN